MNGVVSPLEAAREGLAACHFAATAAARWFRR
jgi:hypothetical protein